MKMLEATKAVADFSTVLDAVQSLHGSFQIVRKGVTCPYVVPAVAGGSGSHEFADDLAAAELSAADRRSFAADLTACHHLVDW